MQFSAIRSWNLARAAEGSLLFCAKALAPDDPRVGPGGQLRAERAKVMSSCGKSDESVLVYPVFHKEGRMHNNMKLDKWLQRCIQKVNLCLISRY